MRTFKLFDKSVEKSLNQYAKICYKVNQTQYFFLKVDSIQKGCQNGLKLATKKVDLFFNEKSFKASVCSCHQIQDAVGLKG